MDIAMEFSLALPLEFIIALRDVTFQLMNLRAGTGINSVSILVLMDVTFQLGKYGIFTPEITSFNPCFNGCYFSTKELLD